MGKVILPNIKKELLPFVKSNLGKLSQREIARRLGVGKTTINRWAKELGFKVQRHSVNEQFFDKWTEQSAYILGLIYSDGNISWNPDPKKSRWAITITASE